MGTDHRRVVALFGSPRLLCRLFVRAEERDALAVGRPRELADRRRLARQPARLAAIGIDEPERVAAAFAIGKERDLPAVRRPARIRIRGLAARELPVIRAVGAD